MSVKVPNELRMARDTYRSYMMKEISSLGVEKKLRFAAMTYRKNENRAVSESTSLKRCGMPPEYCTASGLVDKSREVG